LSHSRTLRSGGGRDKAIFFILIIGFKGKMETFVLQTEKHLAPDADLVRSITMDELLVGVKEDLRTMFKADKRRRGTNLFGAPHQQ
jgi:hypothetical protein